jgi:hypothetical protein
MAVKNAAASGNSPQLTRKIPFQVDIPRYRIEDTSDNRFGGRLTTKAI